MIYCVAAVYRPMVVVVGESKVLAKNSNWFYFQPSNPIWAKAQLTKAPHNSHFGIWISGPEGTHNLLLTSKSIVPAGPLTGQLQKSLMGRKKRLTIFVKSFKSGDAYYSRRAYGIIKWASKGSGAGLCSLPPRFCLPLAVFHSQCIKWLFGDKRERLSKPSDVYYKLLDCLNTVTAFWTLSSMGSQRCKVFPFLRGLHLLRFLQGKVTRQMVLL